MPRLTRRVRSSSPILFYRNLCVLLIGATVVWRGVVINLQLVRTLDVRTPRQSSKDDHSMSLLALRKISQRASKRIDLAYLNKLRALNLESVREYRLDANQRESLFESHALSPTLKESPSYLASADDISKYAREFNSFQRELSFLHIPKTGGSTVENDVQKQVKLNWGKCLFIGDTRPANITKLNLCEGQKHPHVLQLFYHDIPDWHVPSHFFPLLQADNPYEHKDLFVVVRPPLQRMISQYHWYCVEVQRNVKRNTSQSDAKCRGGAKHPAAMFKYFQHRLQPSTRGLSSSATSTYNSIMEFYLQEHGHWIPQYDFIVGPLQTRYVEHVLSLSQMATQYPKLGRAYFASDWQWPEERANAQGFRKQQLPMTKTMEQKLYKSMFKYYQHDLELLFRSDDER